MTALKVGALVPAEGPMRVHSVYRRAVNLEISDARGLVSLVDRAADMAPAALLLDRLPAPLVRGTECTLNRSMLRIGREWLVDCADAQRWDGCLPHGAEYCITAQRIAALRTLVVEHGSAGGLLGLIHEPAHNPVSAFAQRLLAAAVDPPITAQAAIPTAKAAERDVSALVGLGVGLTPSGDDFLAGALLAQELCHASGTCCSSLNRTAIEQRLHATTSAGQTLVAAAVRRQFPAYLLQLTERLFTVEACPGAATPPAAPQRVESGLLEHGQTSATDAAVGMLWFFMNFIKKA